MLLFWPEVVFSMWIQNLIWFYISLRPLYTEKNCKWHIPYGLIFKLKDSKDSKDSNSVCQNKNICNQRKQITKNYFLSYGAFISATLTKISQWPQPLFKLCLFMEVRNSWVTKSSYETDLRKMTSHFVVYGKSKECTNLTS